MDIQMIIVVAILIGCIAWIVSRLLKQGKKGNCSKGECGGCGDGCCK